MMIGMGIIVLSFLLVLGACDLVPPAAPYIQGSYTYTTTTLSWSAVAGANEYIIYYGSKNGSSSPSTFSVLTTTTRTSYTHYTTNAYYYAVKASNNAGTSDFSNVIYTN